MTSYLLDARYSPELLGLVRSLPLGTKLWWRGNDFTEEPGEGPVFITVENGLKPYWEPVGDARVRPAHDRP